MAILGGIVLAVILTLLLSLRGMFNDRLRQAKAEADELENIARIRRKSEDAKHDDPGAIDRVFDKYNK